MNKFIPGKLYETVLTEKVSSIDVFIDDEIYEGHIPFGSILMHISPSLKWGGYSLFLYRDMVVEIANDYDCLVLYNAKMK